MNIKEKGFSLIELIVVVVVIAIVATIAIPMYANYRIRTKISLELKKLGSIKAQASEYIINNSGTISYSLSDLSDMPSGSSIGSNGAIVLSTDHIVTNSAISLVPTIGSGTIIWDCVGIGLTSSQLPSSCTNNSSSNTIGSLVNSLYDPSIDPDLFTFTQFGNIGVSANCISFKCTVAEINGQRWMAQSVPGHATYLYKEDSDDSIILYGNNTSIDSSRDDSEMLQQFVDESILLFNE